MGSAPEFIEVLEVAGVNVRVLGLKMIILSKEQADRENDRATLHILRRILHLKQDGTWSEQG